MRGEIEAAALFITRLVNKNISAAHSNSSNGCSLASPIHSHSSSSSTSSTSSSSSTTSSDAGQPDYDDQLGASTTTTDQGNATNGISAHNQDLDKVEQFRLCLTQALYERFHNHWFPEQPAKGQAYRCIRLNEWDRRDITLQKACSQCGIDYKDLQLPVELTLWVDPDEVTCRFGEYKGSHCLVAKFKDGELRDNDHLDINNIDIEIFRQTTADRMRQQTLNRSPDYNKLQHNRLNNSNGNLNHNGNSYQYLHHNGNNINIQQHHQQHHNNSHHHHQHTQQQGSPHHHRANIAKSAILPTYHNSYPNGCDTNGNSIPYYYF